MGDLVSVLLRVKDADMSAQVGTNSQITIPKCMAFKAYYWFQTAVQVLFQSRVIILFDYLMEVIGLG
jgi:hypothetical protein